MTSFDNLHICRCQLYGCPVTLEATAFNRPTPALEKVRQDVSEARGHTRNHREQPCSIAFDKVGLVSNFSMVRTYGQHRSCAR